MKLISMKKQHESFHFNAVSEEPFHCRTNWLLHPTETPHILIQIKRLVHIMTQMILEKNLVFVCHALIKDFVYLILNVNNHSKKIPDLLFEVVHAVFSIQSPNVKWT